MPQDGDHTTLDNLETDLLAEISAATVLRELEAVRVSALGKKGRVSGLMQQIATMAPDERKEFGQTVNALKNRVSVPHSTRARANSKPKCSNSASQPKYPM